MNINVNQRVINVRSKTVNTARPKAVVNAAQGNLVNAVKASACCVWKTKTKVIDHGNTQMDLQDKGVIDRGCSRYMTGNMSYLTDYEEIDGGYVAFEGNPKGGKITGKDTIRTEQIHLDDLEEMDLKWQMVMLTMRNRRVFNNRKRIVEENLHIRFRESTPNVVCSAPNWLFDIDALTRTMNYEQIVTGTQSNDFARTKTADPPFLQDPKSSHDDGFKPSTDDGKKVDKDPSKGSECKDSEKQDNVNSINNVNAADTNRVNVVAKNISSKLLLDPDMPALEDISTFNFANDDEDDDALADMNNLDTTIQVSHIPTIRIHKDYPLN
nr:hypothetical protein [Tanacetum cinerariifolium]